MKDPIDRMSTCPACTRPLRLTRAELAEGRGFCAVCGAEFDVQVIDPGDGSAFRQQALVVLGAVDSAPRGIQQTGEDTLTVAAAPWAWAKRVEFWLLPVLWPLVALRGMVSRATGRLRDRDELEVLRDALVVRRRRGFAAMQLRVALADIALFTVVHEDYGHHIEITTRDRNQILIAPGLGHGEVSLTWVLDWLRKRLGGRESLQ